MSDCSPGRLIRTTGLRCFHAEGFSREVPFGCVDKGLLSVIYFLPGQAMAPHRHLDSDEYFTCLSGTGEMLVNGEIWPLPEGFTFLRMRETLHAIRNPGPAPLVVQSFQSPIPHEESIVWQRIRQWPGGEGRCCRRCWCGQVESGECLNCGAPFRERRRPPLQEAVSS